MLLFCWLWQWLGLPSGHVLQSKQIEGVAQGMPLGLGCLAYQPQVGASTRWWLAIGWTRPVMPRPDRSEGKFHKEDKSEVETSELEKVQKERAFGEDLWATARLLRHLDCVVGFTTRWKSKGRFEEPFFNFKLTSSVCVLIYFRKNLCAFWYLVEQCAKYVATLLETRQARVCRLE